MALFANRVFEDVLKARIEMRSYWINVSDTSNENFSIRGRRGYMQKGKVHMKAAVGRDWSDVAYHTSQGTPGASRSWKRQGSILP